MNKNGILEIATAFQKSRILLTAYELGLFTTLGKEGKSSFQVSEAIGANERSTDRLMNALCVMGLLKKKNGKFSNTTASLKFLTKESPQFLSGLMHTAHLWDTWSCLTPAVRAGGSFAKHFEDERSKEWLAAFIAAMHERASGQAASVIRMIDLKGTSSILDVGGGSGAYSIAFARAKKRIKSTVFDQHSVIALTKEYIKQAGLSDRIETVEGNYLTDKLGTGFDLIFLSSIIHINSFEENRILLWECSKAINCNGQIVIQDFIMDEDRARPAFGAFFALNMLVGTKSGDTYTESEVKSWLKEAGLSEVIRKDTPFGTTLIAARKRTGFNATLKKSDWVNLLNTPDR